jgi:hypothetical protein
VATGTDYLAYQYIQTADATLPATNYARGGTASVWVIASAPSAGADGNTFDAAGDLVSTQWVWTAGGPFANGAALRIRAGNTNFADAVPPSDPGTNRLSRANGWQVQGDPWVIVYPEWKY